MRLAYYAGASTAAAAACLIKAFHERPNFYSATVYLSQSNACLLILTNLLLIMACSMVYALQRLLYGPLRPIEIEQLSEKAWYAVLDTLLAMPSFREDVGGWLLTMFVLLLAGKVWGWIGEGRVDILEQQPPANPRLFHTRLANSLIFSVIFDVYMTYYCFETVAADPRPGMMVIFTFEFAILTVFSTFTLCRYILSLISSLITSQQMTKAIAERKVEIRAEREAARQSESEGEPAPVADEPIEVDENEVDVPGWEEKRRWLFGLEMTADFLKLLLYIVFFSVSITFNGLPMHIMRDVYMTFASFTKRLADYVNYKKATSDMNARYPDATTEEIRGDACIVCREDMIAWQDPAAAPEIAGVPRPRRDEGLRAKKLPCGHILHLRCLKAWLERQQVCPTCRRPVVSSSVPPVTNVQANPVPGAANPAPPAIANQQQQRAPRRNRARFFNLGPLRIGFLNGPANQVDNIVEQLRGGAPPPQPTQQPRAASQQPPVLGNTALPARMSQAELQEMGQRIMREGRMLQLESQQMTVIRAMLQELDRLVHLHNTLSNSQPQREMLAGQDTQQIPAGAASLPEGLVLPPGWSLLPLERQHAVTAPGPHPLEQQIEMLRQQQVQQIAAHIASEQQRATSTQTASMQATDTVASQPSVSQSTVANHANDIGPTDDAGSPLYVPAAGPSTTQPLEAGQSIEPISDEHHAAADDDENKPSQPLQPSQPSQPAPRVPWSTDSWDFDASASNSTDDHTLESTSNDGHNKGKARAVEVEDEPDSQL